MPDVEPSNTRDAWLAPYDSFQPTHASWDGQAGDLTMYSSQTGFAARLNSCFSPHMKHLLLLTSLWLLAACDPQGPALSETTASSRPAPDVGDIGRYLSCSAMPRRALSEREKCEVAAFRSRCTALDDCHVSCIHSPSGSFVGGRCAHVCSRGPHPGAPPPDALSTCASLTGRSGVDAE